MEVTSVRTRRWSGRASLAVLVGSILLVLAVPSRVLAQGVDLPEILLSESEQDSWISASYAHQLSSQLEDGGLFNRGSLAVGGGHRFRFDEDWSLIANVVYQGSYYDFTDGASPFRWDDIHQITGLALAGWKLDERWSLQGGGLIRAAGESGAEFDDAVTAGGLLGFGYRASDDLQLGLLLGAVTQIEDPAALLLVPQVDWRFVDRWKLHLGLTGLAYTGIGPELSFAPSESWEVALGASYQKRRYRLDDHSRIDDGVGQETTAPIYTRVQWRPHAHFLVDLFAGVSVGGQLRLENRNGDKLQTSGYDPAPILGLNGQFVF